MGFIADMAQLFGESLSQSKAEAFLRGYLTGMGAAKYDADNPPSFDLMAKDPEVFIPIEQGMLEIRKRVTEQQIKEAKDALREIYMASGRAIPEWLKEGA